MSDKKIMIRNCPNITFIDFWRLDKSKSSYCKLKNCGCENYTGCVMKRIVERLIKVCEENLCSRCDGCDWENGCGDKSCGTYQANDILTNLLDIEEYE